MKTFLSHLSSSLNEYNLRPLLYVAGIATASVGAFYFYNKYVHQQPNQMTKDEAVQNDHADPLQPNLGSMQQNELRLVDGHEVEIYMHERTVNAYQAIRLLSEIETNQRRHVEMCRSHMTLHFSHCRWHDKETKVICVKRHYTLLRHGAVSQSWSVLTNDFYVPTAEGLQCYASVHRVTQAVHIDGRLARVSCHIFTKQNVTASSCGVQVGDTMWSCQSYMICNSPCVVTVTCGSEVVPYSPDSHEQEESSKPRPNREADEGSDCIEARRVPALFYYCRLRGIENFTYKLTALRQAFDIVFRDPSNFECVFVAVNSFCLDLASANTVILFTVYGLFDNLIDLMDNPTSRMWTELELEQIGIKFNFVDICFELLLLGLLGRSRVHQVASVIYSLRSRGFLNQLLTLIRQCTSPILHVDRTENYLFHLQTELFSLLEDIFTLEESLYTDRDALAVAMKNCLRQHLEHFCKWLNEVY